MLRTTNRSEATTVRRSASALLVCWTLLTAAPAAAMPVPTTAAPTPAPSDEVRVVDDSGLGIGYALSLEAAPCGGPPPSPDGGWDALWGELVVPGQSGLVVRAVDEAPDGSERLVAGLTARVTSDADTIEVVVPLGPCAAPTEDEVDGDDEPADDTAGTGDASPLDEDAADEGSADAQVATPTADREDPAILAATGVPGWLPILGLVLLAAGSTTLFHQRRDGGATA